MWYLIWIGVLGFSVGATTFMMCKLEKSKSFD